MANLEKFDFTYPGNWISGFDRELAFETFNLLNLIETEFICAVTSYLMFKPTTINNFERVIKQHKYTRSLNYIYAKSFVYSLDSIFKILNVLSNQPNFPNPAKDLKSQYEVYFGKLKHIRDSAAHIEDRGRALDKNLKKISSTIIILGAFNERRFEFTCSDGKCYGIEVSESTLLSAHKIIQSIIDSYNWE
jgi:hypothetical protein